MMIDDKTKGYTTECGIPIKEIYTPEDLKDTDFQRDIGTAGEPPFTRGIYKNMYRGKAFTLRRFSGAETVEDTNKLFKRELELGQTGLAVAPHIVCTSGLGSEDPLAYHDIGIGGVPIDSLRDMEEIFDGIPIDKVSSWMVFPVTNMYFAMAEKRGCDLKQLAGTSSPGYAIPPFCDTPYALPIAGQQRIGLDFIEWCSENVPRWHALSFNTYGAREAGLNAVQEAGMAIACTVQAIEDLKKRGKIPLENIFRTVSFDMGLGIDFFEEIARLRALKRLWYKVAHDRYGMTDPKCCRFRVRTQTGGQYHVAQEPLNNIMRIAFQVLAGTLGGAQAIHPNGYDEALCICTDQSMLLSIRTSQIVQEELNVTSVVDPLGGSYYVEWLTNEMERRIWDYFKKIEDMGGMVKCIESGWAVAEYKKGALEWERKIASGERTVIGVNKYRMKPSEVPYKVPIYKAEPAAHDIQINRIKKLKKERNNAEVAKALSELEKVLASDENSFPALIEAAKAYATLGEICEVERKVYGRSAHHMVRV